MASSSRFPSCAPAGPADYRQKLRQGYQQNRSDSPKSTPAIRPWKPVNGARRGNDDSRRTLSPRNDMRVDKGKARQAAPSHTLPPRPEHVRQGQTYRPRPVNARQGQTFQSRPDNFRLSQTSQSRPDNVRQSQKARPDNARPVHTSSPNEASRTAQQDVKPAQNHGRRAASPRPQPSPPTTTPAPAPAPAPAPEPSRKVVTTRPAQAGSSDWRSKNAWEYVAKLVPDCGPQAPRGKCRALANKPCRRPLKVNPLRTTTLEAILGAGKTYRSKNIAAGLLQVTGNEAPEPCNHCAAGCGPFEGCVVDTTSGRHTGRHMCANCSFASAKGRRCSLRVATNEPTPGLLASSDNGQLARSPPSLTPVREAETPAWARHPYPSTELGDTRSPPSSKKQSQQQTAVNKGKGKESTALFCTPTRTEDMMTGTNWRDSNSRLPTPPTSGGEARRGDRASVSTTTSAATSVSAQSTDACPLRKKKQMFLDILPSTCSLRLGHREKQIRAIHQASWQHIAKDCVLWNRALERVMAVADAGCVDASVEEKRTVALVPVEYRSVAAKPLSETALMTRHVEALRKLQPSQINEIRTERICWNSAMSDALSRAGVEDPSMRSSVLL